MTENILEVSGLIKAFGGVAAVDGVSFCVGRGELFAFLGQNGAGKSTTVGILVGLLTADGGSVVYGGGEEFGEFKNKIGVVFQNNISDEMLSAEENLLLYANLYLEDKDEARQKTGDVIKLLGLDEYKDKRFKNLSGGQKRKCEVARALLMSPDVLFLDEPTTGLDPKTRAEFWRIITRLRQEKDMTVFLTTHYMEEAAAADNVVIIHKGKVIAAGSPAKLKQIYSRDRLIIKPKDGGAFTAALAGKRGYKTQADTVVIETASAEDSIDFLTAHKNYIEFYEMKRGDMDDVFLNAVGENPGCAV